MIWSRFKTHFYHNTELGIADDDWVWIASHIGRVKAQVRLMEGVNADTAWTWNAIGKRSGAWALDKDAPGDLVPAGYSISGLFDLAPLLHLATNADFKLDAAEAKRISPLFWPLTRRKMLDGLAKLNQKRFEEVGDPEINTRIAQYEMAFRMQTSVPELTDISKEPKHVLDMYGPEVTDPGTFAYNCLLARRLVDSARERATLAMMVPTTTESTPAIGSAIQKLKPALVVRMAMV